MVSAERSLAAEFPAAATRTVLSAIGSGSRAYSAILSRTGLSATTLNETLEASRARGAVYRGSAIEHPVRDAIELLLPDEGRFGSARHVGAYWNRVGTVEVDLVGGDRQPAAKQIGFVGSIKWRSEQPFSRADSIALAETRSRVPCAGEATPLVGVSSSGFEEDAPVDVRLEPNDLVAAWRAAVDGAPG